MAVTEALSDEEAYLYAILTDTSGLDLAEFCWVDHEQPDDCWRAWPFQWDWWRDESPLQIDQCSRSVGKSLGIKARAFAFPFCHPGAEMVITAPELVHLEPIVSLVERQFYDTRLSREILPRGRSAVTHRPFQMNFLTGSRIIGRIPQITGKGVKGLHPLSLELDEAQDYPSDGWTELIETLKRGSEGAVWRAHGVTRGIRDRFYEFTQEGPDNDWKIHRITAIHRPNWTDQERQEKIRLYGSREAPDYRRNVLGLHGDQTNPLFVLHRLMRSVDSVEASAYNEEEYQLYTIKAEPLEEIAGPRAEDQALAAIQLLDFPAIHRRYGDVFWCGMDVGFTAAPSEILVFVEYTPTAAELKLDQANGRAVPEKGQTRLKLLARMNLQRLGHPLQVRIIEHVINFYRPKSFGMDKMQPVTEPVLTSAGWRAIGELSVGDSVIGSDGQPTVVTGVYPQIDRRVRRVLFNDGSWTRCGPEHLWVIEDAQGRGQNRDKRMVVTTDQLATLVESQRQRRYRLPMVSGPVTYDEGGHLPLDPYLLGLLLGDGNLRAHSVRFSTVDTEVVAEVEARLPEGVVLKAVGGCDYELASIAGHVRGSGGRFIEGRNPLVNALRSLGLLGVHGSEKFVPEMYLRASPAQRLELLRGLMDADGWVDRLEGSCCIGIRSSSSRLIDGVVDIVEGLGGQVRRSVHATSYGGKGGRTAHKAILGMPDGVNPFKLSRKFDSVIARRRNRVQRFVDRIEWEQDEDSVCIRVAAKDHLYVTRHHLLTHNTGNGLPLFQDIQSRSVQLASTVKGYGFSEKVIVDIDGTVHLNEHDDVLKEAAIRSNVLEYSTDKLRELVDHGRMFLPWDRDLIREFQGQTWAYSKAAMDAYGRRRRVFSQGEFHALDAARMVAMGHAQHGIETFIEERKHVEQAPVLDYFVMV